MGKKSAERRLADDEARAIARTLRVSPRKLNLVARSIRGLAVSAALVRLGFSRRRIAGDVRKVLQSAIANAENNHGLDVDRLYVKEATVGKALVMRRYRPVARGRVHPIRKHISRLTVVVGERGDAD